MKDFSELGLPKLLEEEVRFFHWYPAVWRGKGFAVVTDLHERRRALQVWLLCDEETHLVEFSEPEIVRNGFQGFRDKLGALFVLEQDSRIVRRRSFLWFARKARDEVEALKQQKFWALRQKSED